jgi:hypothetical protein
MSDISKDSRLFSFPDIETPLGRLHFGGILRGGIGTGLRGYRQYGMYAVVLVQAGEGIYRDATGAEIPLVAGDVIIVFPELPHHYGPLPGGRWDEAFVAFSGAAFDAWRAHWKASPFSNTKGTKALVALPESLRQARMKSVTAL